MHSHNHHAHTHHTGNIKVAFFLNLFFTVIEIIGGILTNSIAILSDALHDLGDSLSLGISWYFQKVSNREATKKFTFGFSRFSLFGAIINSIVLILGSVFILIETFPRLLNPVTPKTEGMILLAILGIIFNGSAVWRLKKGKSLNEKVISLHLLEDVLGWVAILLAAIIMQFYDAPILDPLLSVGIAAFILFNVYKNLREALKIILQGTPASTDILQIEKKINDIEGVLDVHDVHLWSMDGEYNILTIHIVLDDDKDLEFISTIKQKIRHTLKNDHVRHITIETERKADECLHIDC